MTALEIISRAPDVRSPSPSIVRLLDMLARPDADNDEVINIVKKDAALSVKLLGLCNSASFGLASTVGSVDQAVFYLGHSQIHRLIMAISFGGTLGPSLPGYAINEGDLWRHSLLTAYTTAKVLAAAPDFTADASIAYTAGIMHDIGKMVLTHALDEETQQSIRTLIERHEHSLVEAETAILGTHHAEVGAALLRRWRLPEVLVEAVGNHHRPPVTPRLQLSAIVHVANFLAHEAGCSPGWGSYAVRAEDAAVTGLGLDTERLELLLLETVDALQDVDEMIAVS